MAQGKEANKEGSVERLFRHTRNVFLGGTALAAAGVMLAPVLAPAVGAGLLAAGGAEVIRQTSKRQKRK